MSSVGVVLPGTSITPIIEKVLTEQTNKKDGLPVIKLGVGLIQSGEQILAVKAGLLYYAKPNKFWIEGRQRRVLDSIIRLVTFSMFQLLEIWSSA